jgi:hypothetical protein
MRKFIFLSFFLLFFLCNLYAVETKNVINPLTGDFDLILDSNITLGYIDGLVTIYNDSDTVTITAGRCEANGKEYILNSSTTYDLTSLTTDFDFHYIYIDDSESNAPVIVTTDTTIEPIRNNIKNGLYNGNDRLIGVIASSSTVSTILYFETSILWGGSIKNVFGGQKGLQLATNMNPSAAWQTPNTNESSSGVPVNAIEMSISIYNYATEDASCAIAAITSEMALFNTAITEGQLYNYSTQRAGIFGWWLILGESRNIKIGGEDDDANALNAWADGYIYTR